MPGKTVAIEAHWQLFVMLEAPDLSLATIVHDIRKNVAPEPDAGDRQDQGWTAHEEESEQPGSVPGTCRDGVFDHYWPKFSNRDVCLMLVRRRVG